MNPRCQPSSVLVFGAGPGGLEALYALGKSGYRVKLAKASLELGDRHVREAGLP